MYPDELVVGVCSQIRFSLDYVMFPRTFHTPRNYKTQIPARMIECTERIWPIHCNYFDLTLYNIGRNLFTETSVIDCTNTNLQ